jgi:hypothetical protein
MRHTLNTTSHTFREGGKSPAPRVSHPPELMRSLEEHPERVAVCRAKCSSDSSVLIEEPVKRVSVLLTVDLISLNFSGYVEPGAPKGIAALNHPEDVISDLMSYEHRSFGPKNCPLSVSDPLAPDIIPLEPARLTHSGSRDNDCQQQPNNKCSHHRVKFSIFVGGNTDKWLSLPGNPPQKRLLTRSGRPVGACPREQIRFIFTDDGRIAPIE